jgi:hypothetical protein
MNLYTFARRPVEFWIFHVLSTQNPITFIWFFLFDQDFRGKPYYPIQCDRFGTDYISDMVWVNKNCCCLSILYMCYCRPFLMQKASSVCQPTTIYVAGHMILIFLCLTSLLYVMQVTFMFSFSKPSYDPNVLQLNI